MAKITTLGIDIAKSIFQLHGVDEKGNICLQKRLTRSKFHEFMSNLPLCHIGMESCAGSNYWAQEFLSMGHKVNLINPLYIKPYVTRQKNDYKDAEAICEAVSRPKMRFAVIKTPQQQDIQTIHRLRDGLIRNRTSMINRARAIFLEYGIVVPKGRLRANFIPCLEQNQHRLSQDAILSFRRMYDKITALYKEVEAEDKRLQLICQNNEICQRLLTIPGVGPITATALIATIGDASVFKNGRQLAAWLGMVPRQSSSGNKIVLGRITKCGNKHIRRLLVHGARSILSRPHLTPEKYKKLIEKSGYNVAYVAFANQTARIIWAVMAHKSTYRPDFRMAA